MLKTLITKMRFVLALMAAIRDPEKTDEIFKVLSAKNIVNDEKLKTVIQRLEKDPDAKSMLVQRHLGTWDLDQLYKLPPNTLGHVYAKHMRDRNLDPNFYSSLAVVSTSSYIAMRMRQTHDIFHAITGFDTDLAGEVGLQGFVIAQLGSPASAMILGITFLHAALFDSPTIPTVIAALMKGYNMGSRSKYLFGEKFEDKWAIDLAAYRQELGIASSIVQSTNTVSI